nr:CCR4-Not transcription complex subunit 1-like [Tanacetum cinerariifolium]
MHLTKQKAIVSLCQMWKIKEGHKKKWLAEKAAAKAKNKGEKEAKKAAEKMLTDKEKKDEKKMQASSIVDSISKVILKPSQFSPGFLICPSVLSWRTLLIFAGSIKIFFSLECLNLWRMIHYKMKMLKALRLRFAFIGTDWFAKQEAVTSLNTRV